MSAINQCQTEITSEANQDQEVLVTATKVADDDRLDVLPRHFPKSFLKFENLKVDDPSPSRRLRVYPDIGYQNNVGS